MGDPKRFRKKYGTPRHPWNATAIELERGLTKEYGLKNKKEIYRMNSILKRYKDRAKKFIAIKSAQGEKEKNQMMEKLQKDGLVQAGAGLDNVLSLGIKDILERRLQSQVYRRGLARTMKQARQFIVHRQIMVGEKKITSPSYTVSKAEEELIRFDPNSPLSKEEHPERAVLAKGVKEEAEKLRKETEALKQRRWGKRGGERRRREEKKGERKERGRKPKKDEEKK